MTIIKPRKIYVNMHLLAESAVFHGTVSSRIALHLFQPINLYTADWFIASAAPPRGSAHGCKAKPNETSTAGLGVDSSSRLCIVYDAGAKHTVSFLNRYLIQIFIWTMGNYWNRLFTFLYGTRCVIPS